MVKACRRELVGKNTKHVLVEMLLKQENAITSLAVNPIAAVLYAGPPTDWFLGDGKALHVLRRSTEGTQTGCPVYGNGWKHGVEQLRRQKRLRVAVGKGVSTSAYRCLLGTADPSSAWQWRRITRRKRRIGARTG
ncbi:WD repeat domain-containing protein [Forsythia ovata]|uniref:WD repeat domain-containing protein n=1 Tax=Forsythia ovata TaxID=205694 RepID=A0ABD1WP51_9LAMI